MQIKCLTGLMFKQHLVQLENVHTNQRSKYLDKEFQYRKIVLLESVLLQFDEFLKCVAEYYFQKPLQRNEITREFFEWKSKAFNVWHSEKNIL